MDRAEATGVGVSLVGHGAVVAVLVLGLASVGREPPPSDAIEVSFVDEVGLVSAAPQPTQEPPAEGMAPQAGPIDDAPAAPTPEPAQPDPRPTPAAAQPAPRQAAPTPARETPAPPRAQQPQQEKQGSSGSGRRTQRARLGDEILKGIGDDSQSRSRTSPAAVMDAQAAADIGQAIQRQIQPCADRQVYPGPGAERIVTPVRLRLNRDGSLAARPSVGRQRGIDDENRRYAERVADLAVRSFVECAPLRGLPAELYDVPRGWSNFVMNYRLPG
jgi:outer membrane biosynthesis protein TonB